MKGKRDMAIVGLFCSALSKSHVIQKGLKINSKTLKFNTVCTDCINSGKRDLLRMGLNKTDADMLLRHASKEEIMELIRMYDKGGDRALFLDFVRAEEQERIALWGRPLDFRKKNKLVYDKDAVEQDIMLITRKHRLEQNFKKGCLKCKELPEELKMTPEDRTAKAIIDKGFNNISGTQYEMMQYRGEVISGNEPYLKNLLSLKEGESFEMPGYAWTTDNQNYAFQSYSGDNAASKDWFELFDKYSLKYHILCPSGTKIMASRSRRGQEYIMPCDSKMKLVKKIVDESGRFVEIFCEHIPNKSINTVS